MKVREAKPSEAKNLVEELWLPLAREMEEVSEYNQLEEDLDIQETIEHKREKLGSGDTYFYIAEESDQKAGFISASLKDSIPVFSRGTKLKLNEIFVKKDFRRKGIASTLMNEIEEVANREDCETIELDVNVANQSAQELYRERGFDTERKKMIKEV